MDEGPQTIEERLFFWRILKSISSNNKNIYSKKYNLQLIVKKLKLELKINK